MIRLHRLRRWSLKKAKEGWSMHRMRARLFLYKEAGYFKSLIVLTVRVLAYQLTYI
jgi:hypothetical protein